MRIEVIATGEELLDGRVTNSNLTEIAQTLLPHGFKIERCVTVGDDPARLLQTFETAHKRADVVIITGGLGPTDDDRTAALLAQLASVPLGRNQKALQDLEAYFDKIQRTMVEANKKQVDLPQGSHPIDNPKGTAPGIDFTVGACRFFALPGVPREMRHMVKTYLIPTLRAMQGIDTPLPLYHTFRCFGAGESRFAQRLKEIYPLPEGTDIGYRAVFPEVHIRLSVACPTQAENEAHMQTLQGAVRSHLQEFMYSEDSTTFTQSLGAQLQEHNATFAVAESCTGGMVGQMMTADAGSSSYFLASLVTYSNQAKSSLLGVPSELIEAEGAVSESVARAMAQGALRAAQSDIAGAITGVAGPGGGTDEKPVGTVHIAVASKDQVVHQKFQFGAGMGRKRIRTLSAYAVLQMTRNLLLGQTSPLTLER